MDRGAPDQQTRFDYSAAGLHLKDAAAAVEPFIPCIREFIATATAGFDPSVKDPLDSYEEDVYCNEFSARCFVKFDIVGDLVKHLWLECRLGMPESLPLCATPH